MATTSIAAKLLSDLKRDFGLTNEQAAGVVGNLMHESGGFNSLQEVNPSAGRGGYGYAQWTGDRRRAFESYAENRGLEPSSYEANYGYLKHELETDPYERRQFNTVKKAKTADEAARLVSENFLRPGKPNIASRQQYANQALSYAGSPVPPGNIASPPGSSVASQLDVRRAPPSPANLTPTGAAVRQMTSPTGGNGDLQTALNQMATRERNRVTPQMPPVQSVQTLASIPSNRNLTQPGAINASVGGLSQDANLAAALSRRSAFGDDPMTPANGPVVASIPSRPAFNGDPLTRSNGPVVATIPSQPNALPRLTIPGSDGSYAGQTERMPATRFNGDPLTPSNGPVVASFPTAGPTTRTVPTTRVSVPPTTMPRMDAVGSMPTFQGLQDMASARFDPNAPDRLNPGNARLPANYGEGIAAQQLAQIGLPSLAPPQITPRQMPVVPARVAPPVNAVAQLGASRPRVAPVPMQRQAVQQPMRIPARTAQPMNILGSGGRSPLNILVSGSNTIQPNTFQGSNTGRTYTPGQVLQTANGPVVANEGGGFTNQATGQVSGHTVSGGLRYDPNGGPSGSGGFVRVR